MKEDSVKEKIEKAVDKFNKYRSPESVAKLISANEKSFNIEFSGPFCASCGFYDYFDDFKIFVEELGVETKIKKVKETDDGAVVELGLK